MKSIKEHAEEYQETALKEKGAILRIDVRNAFKNGAYCVLDEIECILADKELDCEEICDELVALIEQLKK